MAKYEIINGVGIIPEGTEIIKDYAFYNCSELTSVIIPNSVISIDRGHSVVAPALQALKSLTALQVLEIMRLVVLKV